MSPNDKGGTTTSIDLGDLKAGKLRDVAYSANINTEGVTKKDDLVELLQDEGVSFGSDGWMKSGELFEVEERPQRRSGPSDKTALYAFKREATTDDLLDTLEGALEDTDYVVREDATDSGKETWSVVLPAEMQIDSDDEPTYTCAGTKANGEPCTREVDEQGAKCHQHEDT